ncbi:hypothetical protein TNCV_3943081 [Trichonephila clavipes]|nr:hypothetical protein TNCV_3943081 [Trichonephila clavipes]
MLSEAMVFEAISSEVPGRLSEAMSSEVPCHLRSHVGYLKKPVCWLRSLKLHHLKNNPCNLKHVKCPPLCYLRSRYLHYLETCHLKPLEIQKSNTRGLQESKPKLSAGTPGGE